MGYGASSSTTTAPVSPRRSNPRFSSDAALVEAVRARRPGGLALLFDHYSTDVRRILLRILGPDRDLADLIHDVFLAAFESIDGLKNPDALRSWLVGIAVFHARAAIRKRRRWRDFFTSRGDADTEAHAGETSNPEVSDALRSTYAVLQQLPEKERVAFALRYIEGMELAEIADACGTSLSTAKRHVAQGEEKFVKVARRLPELQGWLEGGRWSGH
jgi:RNA polymerase sigma-70 factor (ECF subfamily)